MKLADCEVQTDDSEIERLLPLQETSLTEFGTRTRGWRVTLTDPDSATHTPTTQTVWMRKGIKRCLYLLLFLTFIGAVGIIYFGYYCPESVCALSSSQTETRPIKYIKGGINQFHIDTDKIGQPLNPSVVSAVGPSFTDITHQDFQFDIRGHDVIVFLHIQKTGGTTFGRHLVKDLDLERGCECHRKSKKRCTCLRPGPNSDETWLFSRYSTGWKCGLHADWTELTSGCVDDIMDEIDDHEIKRRYFGLAFLGNSIRKCLNPKIFVYLNKNVSYKTIEMINMTKHSYPYDIIKCSEINNWQIMFSNYKIHCDKYFITFKALKKLTDLTYPKTIMQIIDRKKCFFLDIKELKKYDMSFLGLTLFQAVSKLILNSAIDFEFKNSLISYPHILTRIPMENIDFLVKREKITNISSTIVALWDFFTVLINEGFSGIQGRGGYHDMHFQIENISTLLWCEV
ncbi:unnamed protein product, partial [Meganyctiphanes norvegica]